jgi:hypothetical protein
MVNDHVSDVESPWIVPTGRTPLRTFSVPEGRLIEIFKRLTEPARLEGSVSDVAEAFKVVAGVEARTTVEVPEHVPVFVHATVQLEMDICSPEVELETRVVVGVSES